MKIIDFSYEVISTKLNSSYNLSYIKLFEYESIVTKITLESGKILWGEVTPLTGYTEETIPSIILDINSFRNKILFKDSIAALTNLRKINDTDKVFSLSSILPSLEYYEEYKIYSKLVLNKKDFIFAYDCINLSIKEIQESLDAILLDGYDTVKIKIGKDIDKELLLIDKLSKINLQHLKIRFDANCGYNYGDSCLFLKKASKLLSNNVQYLEQPLCRECWKEMSLLIKSNFKIPIMIDESIYTIDDIKKSYDIGAKYIKLKLCKYGSLLKLQEALDYSKSLDLNVIFGNGVATDISNFYELKFYFKNKNKIFGAVESVGFLKIKNNLKYIINTI